MSDVRMSLSTAVRESGEIGGPYDSSVRAHTHTYRVLSKKEEEKRSREMGNTIKCKNVRLSPSLSLSLSLSRKLNWSN